MSEKLIILLKQYEIYDRKRYEYFLKTNGLDDVDTVMELTDIEEKIFELSKLVDLHNDEQRELIKEYPSGFMLLNKISHESLDYLCKEVTENFETSFLSRSIEDKNEALECFFTNFSDYVNGASEYFMSELLKTDLIFNSDDIYIQAINNPYFEKLTKADEYKTLSKTYMYLEQQLNELYLN